MRNVKLFPSICMALCLFIGLNPLRGQSASEWLTSSGDAARDAWQRAGTGITPRNAKNLRLLWKVKVAS